MSLLSIESKKLLKRLVGYYRHSLSADSSGMMYLRDKLQIHHNLVLEDFLIGYSDGTLTQTLPEDQSVISQLIDLGILDKNGNEKLEHCLVVPLTDAAGDIVNLYVRNVKNHKSRLIYRIGCGIINHRAFGAFESVIIAPTVADIMVFYDRGIQNCAYIYSGGNIDAVGPFYSSKNLKQIYIARFKAANKKPCHKHLPLYFKEKGIATHMFLLPHRSAALFFQRHSLKDFNRFFEQEKKRVSNNSEKASDKNTTFFEQIDEGFIYIVSTRKYEIKGINKKTTQLKVTIKASLNKGGSTPFELSTVDMYSYRARIWFAKLCADLFVKPEDIIQVDLHHILDFAEKYRTTTSSGCVELTSKERREAISLLKHPKLLDQVLSDIELIGVVGEQTNKLVGYLAAVSRKLDEPLSVLIQSRSAAGKSTLQDAILKLVPEEDVLKYTRITDQALFYSGENTFLHKVLAIEEGPGMKGAAYSIRNIQSSGKITIATAGKTSGSEGLQTRQYTVKGPVSVMLTTTDTTLDDETASRFIVLTIDESAKMTRAIHEHHRLGEGLNGMITKKNQKELVLKHHNAQRLLKPMAVINPYARYLTYPSSSLKTRRDFRKYLGLIKAVAFLHQYQRDIKTATIEGNDIEYIEVTLEDIEKANALATEVLGRSLDGLPAPSRKLLDLIFKMVSTLAQERQVPLIKVGITRRMIREHTGWSNWHVRNYLPPLLDLEYLVLQPGSRVNRYAYAVNAGEDGQYTHFTGLQLTSISELKQTIAKEKQTIRKQYLSAQSNT